MTRWSAIPNVPIIGAAVELLMHGRFATPCHPQQLTLWAESSADGKVGLLKRLSPEEEHHAFILASARDIQRDLCVDQWLEVWKTSVAKFKIIPAVLGPEEPFWAASRLREQMGEDFEAMYYTTV